MLKFSGGTHRGTGQRPGVPGVEFGMQTISDPGEVILIDGKLKLSFSCMLSHHLADFRRGVRVFLQSRKLMSRMFTSILDLRFSESKKIGLLNDARPPSQPIGHLPASLILDSKTLCF